MENKNQKEKNKKVRTCLDSNDSMYASFNSGNGWNISFKVDEITLKSPIAPGVLVKLKEQPPVHNKVHQGAVVLFLGIKEIILETQSEWKQKGDENLSEEEREEREKIAALVNERKPEVKKIYHAEVLYGEKIIDLPISNPEDVLNLFQVIDTK